MKFKQKLALSLCTFYLFSIIGVALSMHFCGGKLAAVAVNSIKTNCKYCKDEASNKKDDGCCKNTKIEVKVKDDHQTVGSFKLSKLFSVALFIPAQLNEAFQKTQKITLGKVINKPPPTSTSIAMHVFNCVFRN
jgi:hypothetical protein